MTLLLVGMLIPQIFNVEYEGDQLISYQGDIINDIFGGNPNVFWGFSGSTGALII